MRGSWESFPARLDRFAMALLRTVDFVSAVPDPLLVGASGFDHGGHFGHIRRRLTLIMGGTKPKAMTWSGFLAVSLIGLVTMPFRFGRNPRDRPAEQRESIHNLFRECPTASGRIRVRPEPAQ